MTVTKPCWVGVPGALGGVGRGLSEMGFETVAGNRMDGLPAGPCKHLPAA